MKKFSNITNAKVGQEPEKKETKMNEEESFKFALLGLIDKYLHIQTYGPIDRYLRAGTIKITGKEALAGALAELMSDQSTLEKTILLESLKKNVHDWEAIDEKIDEVGLEWTNKKMTYKLEPHKEKLRALLEKFGEDEDLLLDMAQKSADKMKSQSNAALRAVAATELKLEKLAAIYLNRSNQLFEKK